MKILIDIPTEQYNEIVYVDYERLRDIVRDGVVIEKCEDAISREQALLALTGMDLPTDGDKLIALFTERIQHLPSVTPQPKTGHWIDMHINTLFKGKTVKQIKYQCSVCGFEILWLDKSNKYCRNCGSIMDVYDADKGGNSDADSD